MPDSGIHLAGILRLVGATDVQIDVLPVVLRSLAAFQVLRDVDALLGYLTMTRRISADRASSFRADLVSRDQGGSFLATSVMYVVTARKDTH